MLLLEHARSRKISERYTLQKSHFIETCLNHIQGSTGGWPPCINRGCGAVAKTEQNWYGSHDSGDQYGEKEWILKHCFSNLAILRPFSWTFRQIISNVSCKCFSIQFHKKLHNCNYIVTILTNELYRRELYNAESVKETQSCTVLSTGRF